MDGPVLLEIEGLRKNYNGINALNGIDLTLHKGDFLTIFGPNGAGKTTLIKIIATLLRPSSGRIRVSGYDLEKNPEDFRRSISLISHQSFLYNSLTVEENLDFYAALYRIKGRKKKVEGLLRLMGLYERRDSRVSELSRGMQQRLSIARALINEPLLILLDEPYTGLDQHAAITLRDYLIRLRNEQRTIIMVTHDLSLGLEGATKVGVLVRGRMRFFEDRERVDVEGFRTIYSEICK